MTDKCTTTYGYGLPSVHECAYVYILVVPESSQVYDLETPESPMVVRESTFTPPLSFLTRVVDCWIRGVKKTGNREDSKGLTRESSVSSTHQRVESGLCGSTLRFHRTHGFSQTSYTILVVSEKRHTRSVPVPLHPVVVRSESVLVW